MFGNIWRGFTEILANFFPPSYSLAKACEIYSRANGRYEFGLGINWFEFEAAGYVIAAESDVTRAMELARVDDRHNPYDDFEMVFVTLNRWRNESTAQGRTQPATA